MRGGPGRLVILLALAGLVFAAAMFVTLRPRGRDAADELGDRRADGARGGGGWLSGGAPRARDVDSAAATVRGRVVDPEGVPIVGGALILSCLEGDPPGRMLSKPLRVGEDGLFEGPGCQGETCAQFQHPHMIQDEAWVLKTGRDVELVARLLGRLEGTVVDPDGQPVAGANLLVVPPPDQDDPYGVSPFVSRHATTDADGYFYFSRIERPPCDPCGEAAGRCDAGNPAMLPTRPEMIVTARARGYRLAERRVDADEPGPIELRLEPPAAAISGTLLDGEGMPYARGRVIASSLARPYDRDAVRVDADGTFTLDALGEGQYRLRAIQDGVELATAESVEPGAAVTLEGSVTASGPDVEVTVVGEARRPVPGVTVSGGPFSGLTTDASGKVAVSRVAPGTYRVRLTHGPGAGRRRALEVPDERGTYRVTLSL